MNVDDISMEEIPTDFSSRDMLDWIFERQEQLAHKYVPIEQANGLRYTKDIPVNLDDRFGQAQLKDMFWRVTEELTEAVDAIERHPDIPNHALEELADAMHFLVESYLLSGISPQFIVDKCASSFEGNLDKLSRLFLSVGSNGLNGLQGICYHVIHAIGCASNCLKQRPWKQTHQLVDRKAFTEHLIKAMPHLIEAFKYCGLDAGQVFRMYWKKSEVNKFRIRSNY